MTFSKNVIAPNIGTLQYYVVDGLNGYLYNNENFRAILSNLKRQAYKFESYPKLSLDAWLNTFSQKNLENKV